MLRLLLSLSFVVLSIPSHAWTISRREALNQAGASLALIVAPHSSVAVTAPATKDLQRLQLGHARIQYLLEHWNTLTKVCRSTISDNERKQVVRTEGGGGTDACEKTPLIVQAYMGYKSTNDPLYKIDKLLISAASLVDPDDFENYLDAVERYREKADQTALLAYTSSWGESNPNGGKEVIDNYLEQTHEQVVASERLLRQILGYLHLDVWSPREN